MLKFIKNVKIWKHVFLPIFYKPLYEDNFLKFFKKSQKMSIFKQIFEIFVIFNIFNKTPNYREPLLLAF